MSESNASAISTPRAVSRTHKLTVTAMLSTVAFLLMFIEFPIPALIPAFVKLDISDLPELLAAFSLGPIYGVIVTLLKNVLFSVLHGTSSAYVGELFNFIMGSVFSFTAGFIYQKKKSRKNALIGALAGALLMAVLSVPPPYPTMFMYHPPFRTVRPYRAVRSPGGDTAHSHIYRGRTPAGVGGSAHTLPALTGGGPCRTVYQSCQR